ncbi:MAG: hypothetical protein WC770_10230, partial [Phycisphaerae bacterium]
QYEKGNLIFKLVTIDGVHCQFDVKTGQIIQKEEEKNAQSQEVINAIHLAGKCLIDNKIQLDNYKLIKAENLYINNSKYIGPDNWYVVFKSKNLIPDSNDCPIGMGGEIFIEVDVKNTKAKILGYGE